MEPPRHDDFEPERLASKEAQEKGRRALKTAAKWIRERLQRHAKDPVFEITKLDELRDFFAEEGNDGEGDGDQEINPFGSVTLKAKPGKTTTLKRIERKVEVQSKKSEYSIWSYRLISSGFHGTTAAISLRGVTVILRH